MEGLSEALHQEMKAFNVKVVLIEPGAFQTKFIHTLSKFDSKANEDYQSSSSEFKDLLVRSDNKREQNLDLISDAIDIALDRSDDTLRILVGKLSSSMLEAKIKDLNSIKIVN